MLATQYHLHQLKRLLVHLLGLLILSLDVKHDCEVIHALEGVGMLTAQYRLHQFGRLLVHLLHLLILSQNTMCLTHFLQQMSLNRLINTNVSKLQSH